MTDTAVAPTQAAATFAAFNPADGTSLAVLPMDTDIDAAVAAAAAALPAWAALTPGERSSYLLQIADRLEEYGDELAELESRNVGKPLSHAREEISPSADAMRWAA